MKKCLFSAILTILFCITVSALSPADAIKKALEKSPRMAYKAENNIFYSASELRHIAKGELAGGNVIKVAAATRKRNADPVAALKNFNDQLKSLGISLIVMPVPPKTAIYPLPGMQIGDTAKYLYPFYDELRARGIDVLDLTGIFIQNSANMPYCRTDAHWSPAGVELAARELAKKITLRGDKKYICSTKDICFAGDLAKAVSPENPEKESVRLKSVNDKIFAENSPILVIGDSHTLIFSSGKDMLAENSGLCELLAVETGLPIDRIGIKGSAASAVRVDIFRKAAKNPQWLKNKKYIIYCFSSREFTEAVSGWAKIPVLRK